VSEWRKGPPPSPGWWPASYFRHAGTLRWHDGNDWSDSVGATDSVTYAVHAANIKLSKRAQKDIEWTDRWWETK
jgi:hypothetical protein